MLFRYCIISVICVPVIVSIACLEYNLLLCYSVLSVILALTFEIVDYVHVSVQCAIILSS